jgi:hypothetical protein
LIKQSPKKQSFLERIVAVLQDQNLQKKEDLENDERSHHSEDVQRSQSIIIAPINQPTAIVQRSQLLEDAQRSQPMAIVQRSQPMAIAPINQPMAIVPINQPMEVVMKIAETRPIAVVL